MKNLGGTCQGLPTVVTIFKTCDDPVYPTQQTFFVLFQSEYLEIGTEGIVNEKTAYKGIPLSQYKLEGLSSLNQTNLPGHNSQDTNFASGRDKVLPGWGRHHASQARATALWIENARLPVELYSCAENVRFACQERSIVEEVLCREVVRSIEDNIKVGHDREGILR